MKIYCIGLGGIGMSSVARIAHAQGHIVSGADKVHSPLLDELEQEGIHAIVGHTASALENKPDLILISQAVPYAAPADYLEAKRLEIPMKSWQEYLGELTKEKHVIAICGTHGKSTTTGMVTRLLLDAGMDPTVMIGTKMKELGGSNFRVGNDNYVVIEADEYHENFLNYSPTDILLTSLEPDHLDYYGTRERYEAAFVTFLSKAAEKGGSVFVPKREEDGVRVVESITGVDVHITPEAYTGKLGIFGEHNLWNASLVDALGEKLGISKEVRENSLAGFAGTWRRMEVRGTTTQGAIVYDDYGHHPTEILATLSAFRHEFPTKKLVCIFQPHQYSRSRQLLAEFGTSFGDADTVIIPEIYESRDTEEDKQLMNTEIFADEITRHHKDVHNGQGLEGTYQLLQRHPEYTNKDVVIICMGAGTITDLATKLVTW